MNYSLCWIPACLRMTLAMLREVTVTATLNFLLVIGLNQNSWLPLAWRDMVQPYSNSNARSCG